ncbi:MAG: hypothetical protein ACFFG0_05235 [Candidatus Thorarchaeota archaeon]
MLKPLHEPYAGPISYPISSTLTALATTAVRQSGATDLNSPYGYGDSTGASGFVAGQVCKLSSESSSTVVDLVSATGDDPTGLLADGFTDSLKSGYVGIYFFSIGGLFTVKECYDTGQTYTVGTKLTFIYSGTNVAKLTPASNYGSQTIIARVVVAPSDATADDEMVIELMYQVEV